MKYIIVESLEGFEKTNSNEYHIQMDRYIFENMWKITCTPLNDNDNACKQYAKIRSEIK